MQWDTLGEKKKEYQWDSWQDLSKISRLVNSIVLHQFYDFDYCTLIM